MEYLDTGVMRSVKMVLDLASNRIAQRMTAEDARNLAEVLEGQVRVLRELAQAHDDAPDSQK